MAITMGEIARKLNISIATVSRALSGNSEGVSEHTRQAVIEMAQSSGYQKRKSVSANVAFLIESESFDLSSQFYAKIISGIEAELARHHFRFHFNSVPRERFDLERINIDFGDLAGVIMVGVYHDDFVLKLRQLAVPMVLLGYYIPTEDILAVLIDNANGIIKACRHLASLGHRRVAYLSGDSIEMSAHERLFGYRRAVAMFGLEDDPALVVGNCRSRIDEGFRAMKEILGWSALPSAVVAYNDLIAIGAMEAIRREGMDVPGDISVMGFDDINLAAEVNPTLSTVHVPLREMGALAAERLIEIIRGKAALPSKILVPTSIVVRGSTAVKKR